MKEKIAALKTRLTPGTTPAMATPLHEDGYTVDTTAVASLVDFLLAAGVKGIFAGGTTGEGIVLTCQERQRLYEATVTAVAGRAPVLLHVGDNRVDVAVTLMRHAQAIEADGVAAITPFFYGISDDGLAAYYQAIAQAAPEMPLLLYDMPHLAVNGIQPALYKRLASEIGSLAGMKSSRPDVQMVRRLVDASADHLLVLAGNESAALGLLTLGVDGLISGLSTAVPEPFVALTTAVSQGDLAAARHYQRGINEMLAVLPDGARIGALKTILVERGIIPCATAVPPRPNASQPIWPHIRGILDSLGLNPHN